MDLVQRRQPLGQLETRTQWCYKDNFLATIGVFHFADEKHKVLKGIKSGYPTLYGSTGFD